MFPDLLHCPSYSRGRWHFSPARQKWIRTQLRPPGAWHPKWRPPTFGLCERCWFWDETWWPKNVTKLPMNHRYPQLSPLVELKVFPEKIPIRFSYRQLSTVFFAAPFSRSTVKWLGSQGIMIFRESLHALLWLCKGKLWELLQEKSGVMQTWMSWSWAWNVCKSEIRLFLITAFPCCKNVFENSKSLLGSTASSHLLWLKKSLWQNLGKNLTIQNYPEEF